MVLLTSNDTILKLGSTMPQFALTSVDGKAINSNDLSQKKAVLILFACNHCPYVIPKMDFIVYLQSKYAAMGLQIIAINSNDPNIKPDDSFENMKKISKEKKFNFPYLFDSTQEVAKKFGAVCTPDPFLFNSQFKLVYHGRVDDAHGKTHSEASTNDLEEAISNILSGAPASVKQHPSMGCSIKWRESNE